MNEFRKNYNASLGFINIFVVVSDDLQWCKNTFQDMDDVYFSHEDHSPYLDLAILSKCNHSIFGLGTFGWWGAYLAGGNTILAKDYTQKPKYTMNFIISCFPTWKFMSGGPYDWEIWLAEQTEEQRKRQEEVIVEVSSVSSA